MLSRNDNEAKVPRSHVGLDSAGFGTFGSGGSLSQLLLGRLAILMGHGQDDVAVLFTV